MSKPLTAPACKDMDPKRLELELTESVLMTGAESTASTLQALRRKCLSYLQKFPVDCL